MAYYDIDTAKFIKDNVPARKRMQLPVLDYLLSGLLNAFTRWVSIFKLYKEGNGPLYTPGTYNYGELLGYNGRLYECTKDGTTTDPSDSNSWRLLFSYIGTNSSQLYNGTVMQFEYALNTYFGLNYSPTPLASDIYIVTNTIPDPQFLVSTLDTQTSTVGLVGGDTYVGPTFTLTTLPKSFTIYVPFVWYFANFGTTGDGPFTSFVNLYVTEGTTYSISTY